MKTLYAARFARVTENLARQGLTQMIVSDPPTIFYLTGVRIQPGERMLALLLRADGNHRFFVNALFGIDFCPCEVRQFLPVFQLCRGLGISYLLTGKKSPKAQDA